MPETEQNDVKQLLPPYVPYRTFVNFLDSLHSVVMPTHIDKAVMASMSGGIQSWLKASLRSMKLIDADDVPQDRLKKLVAVQGEERKPLLIELFNVTYAPLLKGKLDLQATTSQQLKAAFADLGAQGETQDKCAAFLMALAKDAGLTLSPHLKRITTRRRPRVQRVAQNGTPIIIDHEHDDEDEGESAAMKKIALPNAGGSLTLSGSFNLFRLSGDERELVFQIIDKMNEFETKSKGDSK
jgi:hypothetical protein